jgi:hypothetical protein
VPSAHQEQKAVSHAIAIGELSRVTSRPAVGVPAPDFHAIENPLWIIVIGMACFFGSAALIIAWG